MPRRCLCSILLDAVRDDPRLATLPLAVQMFWLKLAQAVAELEQPGRLPFAETRRVALLVRCSETEAETHLETLRTEGLIRDDGGGLVVPIVQAATDRAATARRNGAAGGRPKKGETREQYLARRQTAMALPIAGGKPSETEPAKPSLARDIISSESTQMRWDDREGAGREGAATTPEWVSLGVELAALAGMDGMRGGFDYRPVQAWLNAGHSPAVIRAAVQRVVDSQGYGLKRVFTLKFFDRAVVEQAAWAAHEAAAAPKPRTAEDRDREAREDREIEDWKAALIAGRDVPLPSRLAARQVARQAAA
jgi:hypothetical protein